MNPFDLQPLLHTLGLEKRNESNWDLTNVLRNSRVVHKIAIGKCAQQTF